MTSDPFRVYLYRNPIITCRVPNNWISEAIDEAQQDGEKWINWIVARKLGERLFCSYYGLESKYRTISDGINNFRITTVPISDGSPKIGRHFECKARFAESQKPVIHIFQTWYLPQIDIIGWIANENLPMMVREQNLNGMHECMPLAMRDTRNKYI